jgi:hypothetical protein
LGEIEFANTFVALRDTAMRIILKQLLPIGLAILAITEAAQADDLKLNPPWTTNTSMAAVAAVAPTAELRCTTASPERANELADQAWQDGSYQLAGECYLAASEPTLADRAFVKAVAPQAALTARKLAENRDEVKAQIHQWKQAVQAFRPAH